MASICFALIQSLSIDVKFNFEIVWFERCVGASGAQTFSNSHSVTAGQTRAMSLDLEKQSANMASSSAGAQTEPIKPIRKAYVKHSFPAQTDTKIMVVWLESLEDYAQFPIGNYNVGYNFSHKLT